MPDIKVYASLPFAAVTLTAELDLSPTNWRWVHCLTFPVNTLRQLQFSLRPYKWIRYATGVVVGAEGHLSSTSDSCNSLDHNGDLPSESAVLYYHTSDEEKRRMFPADPHIGHTCITSSVPTPRRRRFRDGVAEREGSRCVLSGLHEIFCDGVHLISHSKGDAYISTYTRRRSRDPTGGDIVEDIDSIWNGLLLHNSTHRVLGTYVAFLMTPNFAMDASDIVPNAPSLQKRYTAHLFQDIHGLLGDTSLSSGAPLRISDNSEYPPAILFDAVYASAVLYHFGTQMLNDDVATSWNHIFYPDGVMTARQPNHKAMMDQREANPKRKQELGHDRQARHDTRNASDMLDIIMGLPYMLMPKDQLRAKLKELEEKEKVMEQQRVQEKVSTWMKEL